MPIAVHYALLIIVSFDFELFESIVNFLQLLHSLKMLSPECVFIVILLKFLLDFVVYNL